MFKIEIKTGNAAFRDDCMTDKNGEYVLDPQAHEVRRILREIEKKLLGGYEDGYIFDINGNRVGKWSYCD